MTISVAINGYKGKMGSESVIAVGNDPELELIACTDVDDNFQEMLTDKKPQAVLDFTHPDTVFNNTKSIIENGSYAVIGTTGLTDDQLNELDTLSKSNKLGVAICPNFAIGAILMMQLASKAAKYLPRAEIIEYHHDKKADAPSGTAIKTAQMIQKDNPTINNVTLDETELIKGSRGGTCEQIPIHSIRLPGYIASQEVILGGLGQTLTIRHDTISRESFMPGVVLAIKEVTKTTGLTYGLENFL